jgi:uncharacterized membrane protein (DUF2068 family)
MGETRAERQIEIKESGRVKAFHDAEHGTEHVRKPARRFDRGLLTIGLFKLVEATFFFLVGVGAIHFLHSDLGDAAMHVVRELRADPEGNLVTFVMDHIDGITAHRLKEIGAVTFLYAALRLVEGAGLMLQKAWAEYLTLVVTASFIPWELYEIVVRWNWFKLGLLVVNLVVLAYLVRLLRQKRQAAGE